MSSPDWNDYRYFLAVAESGSLSAAGRRLGVNQPTVGRRIAELEACLGVRLFHRHARGLSLSAAGQRILEAVSAMAEAAATVERAVGHDDARLEGRVRVSAPESLCFALLAPALPRLHQRHPGIELVLQASPSAADLPRGEADLALRLFRPEAADLVVRRVGEVVFALYAAPAYLEQAPPLDGLADLPRHTLLSAGEALAHVPEIRWLAEHGRDAAVALRSDSFPVLARAAAAGLGIALLPEALGRDCPGLAPVLPGCRPPPRQAWLVVHKDLRYVARVRAVLEFLAELFAGH